MKKTHADKITKISYIVKEPSESITKSLKLTKIVNLTYIDPLVIN